MMKKFKVCASLIVALSLSFCGAAINSAAWAKEAKAPEWPAEKEVSTQLSAGMLSGAYIDAGQGAPIVIIVPGSGPTDRDGNNGAFVSNALKFLAADLARQSISSIRVDKRGMFSSASAGNPNNVRVDVYGEDYRKWAETAIELSGQDCAFLLGHSEGGIMVSAAALGQENICGIITVAAPGFKLGDVLWSQLKSNPANRRLLKPAKRAITALEAGERVDVSKMHSALQKLFNPQVQDYLISLFAVDPAQILAATDVPKLVIQGEHDVQVSKADAQRLAQASGAKLVIIPKMNHVLKTAPKRRSANIKAYTSPNIPIDSRVSEAAAAFVHDNK